MSTRLSQTLTHLAVTQLEMLTVKSMDADLKQTIDKLTSTESQCREELTSVRGQLAGALLIFLSCCSKLQIAFHI